MLTVFEQFTLTSFKAFVEVFGTGFATNNALLQDKVAIWISCKRKERLIYNSSELLWLMIDCPLDSMISKLVTHEDLSLIHI